MPILSYNGLEYPDATPQYDDIWGDLLGAINVRFDGDIHDLQLRSGGYSAGNGSANTYTMTFTTAATTYQQGAVYFMRPGVTNTGASTVNMNGWGAKAIQRTGSLAVQAGDLQAGTAYPMLYDGSVLVLMGLPNGATGTWARSVRVATTGNITLSGLQTIDGVTVAASELVLVQNQTAPAENGVYVAATGAWPRHYEADTWLKLVGQTRYVEEGANGGGFTLQCQIVKGGTLGTTAVTWAAPPTRAAFSAHGRCRIALSGGNIVLSPFNGNGLVINGVPRIIPGAGVSLAATGMAATTLYYIYAFMSGGAMTLEASTTGHVTGTDGMEIKAGDATRTLVGMAWASAAATWGASAGDVANWFNRAPTAVRGNFTAARSTTSNSLVEINSEIRCNFLSWGGVSSASFNGVVSNSGSGQNILTGISLNGGAASDAQTQSVNAGSIAACGITGFISMPEGRNYLTITGATSGSTAVWFAQDTYNASGRLAVIVIA